MKSHNVVILVVFLVIIFVAIWLVGNYFSQNELITNCLNSGGTYSSTTQTCTVVSTTTNSTTSTTPTTTNTSVYRTRYSSPDVINRIQVTSPQENAVVSSPLQITGQSRGWYFEATFPVSLVDSNGRTITETFATAQGDWMTNNFVPFTSTITFPAQPSGSRGFLILRNDNPSGLPENSESVEIPVIFR